MKVVGIISEFNPFHNGHSYLIENIKKLIPDSAIVAIMSGNFTERGDVAIINKYQRARSALHSGVDLVLELPAPWSFSGAEHFSLGGISIAEGLSSVDYLVFGSECGNIDELKTFADNISSEEFLLELSLERKKNMAENTAVLRRKVYEKIYGESELLLGSNNILAISYLTALKKFNSNIEPITFKRVGEDFNSTKLSSVCSASAIRNSLKSGSIEDFYKLKEYMPEESYQILQSEYSKNRIYSISKLDTAVISLLRAAGDNSFDNIHELNGGIQNKLINNAYKCTTINELVDLSTERRYSKSRLRRGLLSALLSVSTKDVDIMPEFTNVLGANEIGRKVLSFSRKKAKINILSKISSSSKLSGIASTQYMLNYRADKIYELCSDAEPSLESIVLI